MKKRILALVMAVSLILSMSVITVSAETISADTAWYNADQSEFTITTAAELAGLSSLVDGGTDFSGKTVKLGADIVYNEGTASEWATTAPANIWNPIGSVGEPTNAFKGTFDGQGYTISGLYVPATSDSHVGLFAACSSATLKNFRIENSYFGVSVNQNYGGTGSAVGFVDGGGITVMDVYSNAIIESNAGETGGIVGRVNACAGTITNCQFDGTITCNNIPYGGIVGTTAGTNPSVNITNCAFTGVLGGSGVRKGGMIGLVNTSTVASSFTNCVVTGTLDANATDTAWNNTGYIAGRGQSTSTATGCFGIAADNGKICGGYSPTKTTGTFTGLGAGTKPYMDAYFAAGVAQDYSTLSAYYANSSFNIGTAAQLVAFSAMSQAYNYSGKTVNLTADITLNTGNASDWATTAPANIWLPIGSETTKFAGTFNGNGLTISGMYCSRATYATGMFGVTSGATIKDFKLVNSYFGWPGTAATGANGHFGAIIGWSFGASVSGIYTDAIVNGSNTNFVGGFVGSSHTAALTISNCQFDGSVTGFDNVGGFLGGFQTKQPACTAQLSHCLFTGTVTANSLCGGIAGMTNGFTSANIADSLSAGTVDCATAAGSVVGSRDWSNDAPKTTATNAYGTTECYATVIRSNQSLTGATAVAKANITGEAAYTNAPNLDYTNYWIVPEDGIPELQKFSDATPADPPLVADTSWYDAGQTEFVITTAAQLKGFSELAQTNNFSGKTVKLGADIVYNEGNAADWATGGPKNGWAPIGKYNSDTDKLVFSGTFDGQGYTISGIYVSKTVAAIGMFGYVQNATIKDFKLVNSYFAGGSGLATGHMAAIAGWAWGATISDIYTDAILYAPNTNFVGGIVGTARTAALNISNCQFDGTITAKQDVGGILGGYMGAACTAQISHCLFTGSITADSLVGGIAGLTSGFTSANIADTLSAGSMTCNSNYGSVVGSREWSGNPTNCTNAYGTTECCATTIRSNQTLTGATAVATALITGSKAYLNAPNLDYDNNWVVEDGKIPALRKFSPNATPAERPLMPDTSWYDDGETEFVLTETDELLGFAQLAQTKTFSGKTVKLGANITMNEGNAADWAQTAPDLIWTPAGNDSVKFSGTFDGQGYTISGMYAVKGSYAVGMFGVTSGATIKNFKLLNSYIGRSDTPNAGTTGHIGSIIGWSWGATVSDIYTNAIVNAPLCNYVGGIVGTSRTAAMNISNCWFDGTVSANKYGGGIIGVNPGQACDIEIAHCLFTGSANAVTESAGGIMATCDHYSSALINDCLSAGTVTSGEGYACSIIGNSRLDPAPTITNTYGTVECNANLYDSKPNEETGATYMPTGAVQVTGANSKGANAYANMPGLDYETYWFVEDGELPVLKTFATASALANEAVGKFAAVSENGTETLVNTFAEACDGAYVKLITNAPITLAADTVVDVNNRTVTINNDDFVLSILDSNSDNYGEAVSKVTVTDAENLNVVAAKPGAADQYVALENADGTYTPHWLYVKLTTASLKANSSSVSIYYKSSIKADSALTDYITAYGIAASLIEIPEDFRNDAAVGYTVQEFEAPEEGDIDFTGVSGIISNVLQKGRQDPDLDTCGTMSIYASAYVTVEIGGETYDVMGVASSDFSLYDLMCKLNNTYTAGSAPENVKVLVANWEDPMSGWGLDNLQ